MSGDATRTIPAVGRIVRYKLTEDDATGINRRRKDADNFGARDNHTGYAVHVGNEVQAGDVAAMVIVRVWPDDRLVNGQVLLDGTDTLWVTSKLEGDRAGEWSRLERN